jgi:transposase
MKSVHKIYIGVDISKNSLDFYIYPTGKHFKIQNQQNAIECFIKSLADYDIARIACEATGGYEILLNTLLQKNGYLLWIVDPVRIKGFIISTGIKAKTDKIDAKKIAEFASKNEPNYKPLAKNLNGETLKSLVNRKKDIIKFSAIEKTRLDHPSHSEQESIKRFIEFFAQEIMAIDQRIQNLILVDDELNEKAKLLVSIPGIGKASSSLLLSFVPELGTLSNKQIAALVGLCPYDNESGISRGKKFIKRGRAIPRNALYMCALTSVKHQLPLKIFYNRLIEKGKPFKVAIVAVMRKLIILANILLKKRELWSANYCKVN